jgi:hypothetical protein
MVEAVARLVHEHVRERERIVAAVAGHHDAAVATLMAQAVDALSVDAHEPLLEDAEVLRGEERDHEALPPPHRLTPGDAVEVAEEVVHGVELGGVGGQLGRGDVAGDEKLVRAADDECRKRGRHLRHEPLQFGDLRGVLLGRQLRPGLDAARPHPLRRLGLLPFTDLPCPAAACLPGRPLRLRLVDRLAAGDDPGDARRRHADDLRIPLQPEADGRGLAVPLRDTLEHRTYQPFPGAQLHEVEGLADMRCEGIGELVGPAARGRDERRACQQQDRGPAAARPTGSCDRGEGRRSGEHRVHL